VASRVAEIYAHVFAADLDHLACTEAGMPDTILKLINRRRAAGIVARRWASSQALIQLVAYFHRAAWLLLVPGNCHSGRNLFLNLRRSIRECSVSGNMWFPRIASWLPSARDHSCAFARKHPETQ
jgi:hypothetical protein